MSYEDTFRDSLSRMRVDSCLSGYFDIPLEKGMELESGRIFVGTVYSSFIVDAIYKTAIKYVFVFFWFTVGMTLLNYVINFGNIIAEYKAL